MNGTLKVTPEELISASNEFANCSSVIRGLTSQMVSEVNGLNGAIWSGEAATAYISKFKQLDDDIERDGVSPTRIFGLSRETMIPLLNGLTANYPDFISASFTLDLENITLRSDKSAQDVLELF